MCTLFAEKARNRQTIATAHKLRGVGLNLSQTLGAGHTKPPAEALMTKIRFDDFVEDSFPRSGADGGSAILAPPSQEDIESAVTKLPPLPALLQQLMQELRSAEADIGRLEEGISSDPGLTTRVLKMANSPFYKRSVEIVDVQRAIMTLGIRTVSNLVLAAGLRKCMGLSTRLPTFSRNGIFQHSLASAICCARLGAKVAAFREHQDGLFIAGLLHDVGRVALAPFYAERASVVQDVPGRGLSPAAESELLGVDHTEVGRMVHAYWDLPSELEMVISQHHQEPTDIADDRLTLGVVIVDEYLNRRGFARTAPQSIPDRLEQACGFAGMDPAEIDPILEDFEDEVAGIMGAFA